MKQIFNKHPDTVIFRKDGWRVRHSSVRMKKYNKHGYNKFLEVNQTSNEKCLCCGVYALSNIHIKDNNTELYVKCNCTKFSCDCETCTKMVFSDMFTQEQLDKDYWERLIEIVSTQYLDWGFYAQNTYNYKHMLHQLKRKSKYKIKYTFSEKVFLSER